MIKLKNILNESILIPRRSKKDRLKYYRAHIYKKIKQYIKNECAGNLYLTGALIEYLPDNLKKVGGDLDLSGSQIKKLPDGLEIDGRLWLWGCPIETYPTNVKAGKNVSISSTHISKLPDNLTINGSLWIACTEISEIPNNLIIKGILHCWSTLLTKKYTPDEIKQMIKDKGGSVYGISVI